MRKFSIPLLSAVLLAGISYAQTVGLFYKNAGTEDGYILFAPTSNTSTYLIDKCGKKIHEWSSAYRPGQAVYLLENGTLLRTGNVNNSIFTSGGTGGIIELLDTNSTVLWSYLISDNFQCQHHDIYPLPNGNVLAIVWDRKTQAEAIGQGRNPAMVGANLWSEKIIEIQPTGSTTGNIVWQWNAWDHLVQEYDSAKPNFGVIAQHPELINLNYYTGMATQADWLHFNAVFYNPVLNQLLISNHNFSEIWVIDKSTSTNEAAGHTGGAYGHGGDLLYRWGNPAAYNRGAVSDKKFFGQHSAHWIPAGFNDAGNIMVFNNGLNRPGGNYSSVEIIAPPIDAQGNYTTPVSLPFQPDSAYWKYTAPVPTGFYSSNISGAHRLSNGNTIICEGDNGIFFEIDTGNATVWKYVNPVNMSGPVAQNTSITGNTSFRCTHIPLGYPGLSYLDLTPGNPVELNPLSYACSMTSGIKDVSPGDNIISVYPNPFSDKLTVILNSEFRIQNTRFNIFNPLGEMIHSSRVLYSEFHVMRANLPGGIYFYQLANDTKIFASGKIIIE